METLYQFVYYQLNQSELVYIQNLTGMTQQSTVNTKNQSSPLIKADLDGNQSKFNFTPQQLLKFWLLKVLPPQKQTLQINYQDKILKGPINDRKQLIGQLQAIKEKEKEKTTLVTKQIHFNCHIYLEKIFNCKIFKKQEILHCLQKILETYNHQEVRQQKKKIKRQQYVYFIHYKIQHTQLMNKLLQKIVEKGFVPGRKDIKEASIEKLTKDLENQQSSSDESSQAKQDSNSQEQIIDQDDSVEYLSDDSSDDQSNNFYTNTYDNKQNAPKQAETKQMKYKKPKKQKKSQEQPLVVHKNKYKQFIFNEKFPIDKFDVENFKNWVRAKKICRITDFQFATDYEQKTITVRMDNSTGLSDQKISTVKIYFNYCKVYLFDNISQHTMQEAAKKFNTNSTQLKCRLIQGYMEPRTFQNKLWYLIKKGLIHKNESRTKQFTCFFIVGIKYLVQKYYNQIDNWVQLQEKLYKSEYQKINIEAGDYRHYLPNKRLESFLTKMIKDRIKELNKKISLKMKETLVFQSDEIVAEVYVKNTKLFQQFQKQREQIQKKLLNNKSLFHENELSIQDFPQQLKKQYLVFKNHKEPGKTMVIQHPENLKDLYQKIQDQQKMCESEPIFIKKKVLLSSLKSFIEKKKKIMPVFSNQEPCSVKLIGTKKDVNKVKTEIEQFLCKEIYTIRTIHYQLSPRQYEVLQKNYQQIKKDLNGNHKVEISLVRTKYDIAITWNELKQNKSTINTDLLITISNVNKNYDTMPYLPQNAFFFFRDISEIFQRKNLDLSQFKKQIIQSNTNQLLMKRQNHPTYIYSQQKIKSFSQLIQQYNKANSSKDKQICFFLFVPQKRQIQFVKHMIQQSQKFIMSKKKKIKIHMLNMHNKDISQQLTKHNMMKKYIQYYVQQGASQMFYSEQGDMKINQAIQNGQNKVYLSGKDMQLNIKTHKLYLSEFKMVSLRNRLQTTIQINAGRYTYVLDEIRFQIPYEEIIKAKNSSQDYVQISLSSYQIDLISNKQKNMFTRFERQLKHREVQKIQKQVVETIIQFNHQINEVQIQYTKQKADRPQLAYKSLKQIIASKNVCRKVKMNFEMTQQLLSLVSQAANESELQFSYDISNSELSFSGSQQKVKSFQVFIPILLKNLSPVKQSVQFPKFWEPQKQDIQLFEVPKNSNQFQQIQKSFTYCKISKLTRIQNKIVYTKYDEQKKFLKRLNDGKDMKQLMLFHGTYKTNPEEIYCDKQQCFNINYTNDNNYLGKAAYFAVESKYSHNYSYLDMTTGLRSMMYCQVLVGESQKINSIDGTSKGMKDTIIKDAQRKLRYQSSTTFTCGSDIYAIYKSRRAYPMYLIQYQK